MSEVSEMLLDAHRELIADGHGCDVVTASGTRKAILTPAVMSEALRKAGQMLQISQTCEMETAFATALGIVDRTVITIAGQGMRVMVIEGEPADPLLLFHLKVEH